MPRGLSLPAARAVRHVETRFIASHPLGAQPRTDILPRGVALRDVRDAMNRVSTQRTSSLAAISPQHGRPI